MDIDSLRRQNQAKRDEAIDARLKKMERDLGILARAILHQAKAMNGYWTMEDIERIARKYEVPPSSID